MQRLIQYPLGIALFVLLDYIWFQNIASQIYKEAYLPFVKAEYPINTTVVVSFVSIYFLMVLGIREFVLEKANRKLTRAMLWGAVYGLIIYGVYNLTSFIVIAQWSQSIVWIDSLWGAFACSMVSACLNQCIPYSDKH